jgi:hypothetical protein
VLGPYQQPDGAITVFPDGATVEPYFAMRALLAAQALGLDAQPAAEAWIRWQLQQFNGPPVFARYCRAPGASWRVCGTADADDAALALWLELLYVTGGARGSSDTRAAAMGATRALAKLYDKRTGIYTISPTLPVSLLMDNIEIASAFDRIGQAQDAAGQHGSARASRAKAASLRRAIDRTFWDSSSGSYRITTQKRPPAQRAFYPDDVAEGYPAFFGYGSPAETAPVLFSRWMDRHGTTWLGARDREYPWGLIALAASRFGDRASAVCWLGQAISLRHGPRWNVLEEAILQGLMPAVSAAGAVPPCVRNGARG